MRSLLVMLGLAAFGAHAAIPDYAGPVPASSATGEATAVFAGGCFWGVDAVFKHVKGVKNVVSGYSGGSAATAKYMLVGTGATGHAESVQVTFDPSKVGYPELLKIFFSVAHDPTQRDRQGPDVGSQYRSRSSTRTRSRRKSPSTTLRSSTRRRCSASRSPRR